MDKINTPTFYNIYRENGWNTNTNIKFEENNRSLTKGSKEKPEKKNDTGKIFEIGQKVDTKDLIELKESITKFYKKINSEKGI
jgi:hypothetical protein